MAITPDLSGNAPMGVGTERHVSDVTRAHRSYTVTASDSTDLPNGVADALTVAVSGNVKFTYLDGTIDTAYILAGIPFFGAIKRVWATGTTATGINAVYS